MNIIINPGTGHVPNATEQEAITNIKHWLVDCGLKNHKFIREPQLDADGRFGFIILEEGWDKGVFHRVEMPGIPLDKVRYMDTPEQNIWDFPRLYVDGSSWVWMFSLLEPKDFEIIEES